MDGDPETWSKSLTDGAVHLLYTMPKPTVALVNGPVAGCSLGFAFGCDLRLCSEQARFVTGYRNIGLSGDGGSTFFMTKFLGPARSRELFFTVEPIDAWRALELGLATRVYPHDRFMEEGLRFCAELAVVPTLAFGRMKASIALATTGTPEQVRQLEGINQAACHQTRDYQEAAQAFVERRPPRFVGA